MRRPQRDARKRRPTGLSGVGAGRPRRPLSRPQGSRFFKREQQRDAMVSEKVAKMRADLAAFQLQDQGAAARHVDALVQQLEAQRDLTRTIVHVDMDGPSTSVHVRRRPAAHTAGRRANR